MLAIRDLTLSIQGRVLLREASAMAPAGRRVGVVGRNGSGKTTLFRAIRGELPIDGGEIEIPRAWRVAGVEQEAPATDAPLIDLVLDHDTERAALLREAEALERSITSEDAGRIAEIQMRLADIGAHSAEARAAAILSGLGFDAAAQARPSAAFSGGWRMRAALAGALLAAPDLLLLDEPTNYLDLEGVMWLEAFLARYPNTVLLISHDRRLLNRAVNGVLHLSEQSLAYYPVPYDKFAAMRRERLAQIGAEARRQDAERARIQSFVDRFRAKATKARQAQARLKMLERMEPIVTIAEEGVAAFDFPDPETLSPPLVALDGAAAGYGGKAVLSGLDLRIDAEDRIALLGQNGQGKSTFAKLICGALEPLAGKITRSGKLRIGYFAQHQLDGLTPGEDAVAHLRRLRPEEPPAKLRARLGAAGLPGALAETPVEKLSGGQKARLLMALATLDAPHLLILDEPTNHLDIESRAALAQALTGYAGAVILISHDSDLVETVADRLWRVGEGGVAPFEGDMAAYRQIALSKTNGPAADPAEKLAGKLTGKPDANSAANSAGAPPDGAPTPPPREGRQNKRRAGADQRRALAPLRAEAIACEERVRKLEEMKAQVAQRLADPELYAGASDTLESLGRKRAEIDAGLERAEALWLDALERLEAAEGG
ncbi:MAG: ABC-F family ATP-binding cassette domain-containing protein [Pseudomonadota bacterium]